MHPDRTLRWLTVAAVTVCGAGLWFTVSTWTSSTQTIGFINAKSERLAAIRALGDTGDEERSARAALAAARGGALPNLEGAAEELLRDTHATIEPAEPYPAVDGWMVHNAGIRIPNVRMESLAQFVALLESERPPWRLVGCTLSALPGQPGQVRAELDFEGLEYSGE